MMLVRGVFQAKYGKGGDLVALFKEASQKWPQGYADRVLTDVSGPFFIVVVEAKVESLADWERRAAEIFAHAEFGDWFARMEPLVESGRREFYNMET
ncbi:MAG: hypothetical protein P8186_22325 [Anaerolineae bacterium]|jgi:hypothetical protein